MLGACCGSALGAITAGTQKKIYKLSVSGVTKPGSRQGFTENDKSESAGDTPCIERLEKYNLKKRVKLI
jgi:hypothetical protein